ncbi:hypothetical protein C2S53_017364 [Perilla frutescens var. hirtella]|uniref:Uncharacterized protein n=1 Tax=Perilla frutescens var. hirtella TaxID=608512 RepID=A0AAD4P7B4_PERFH|nr:hypothetical protein C2S53_017364 [Perilla frutescens var. hirtella]
MEAGAEAAQEDDGSVVASWLVVDDETASELSKLLDLFEAPPPPLRVRFIENPYSSPVIFQSSSAFVTINGNEESCGSSYSDSDSSVMASIDVGGARVAGGAWVFDPVEARGADVDVELGGFLTDGLDYRDDATWQQFLGEMFE